MEAMRLFTAIFTRTGRPARSLKQLNDSTLAKARSLPRNPSRRPRKDESKTFILTPRGSMHDGQATNKSIGQSRVIRVTDLQKQKKASELKKLNKKQSKASKKQKEFSKRDTTAFREKQQAQEAKNVNLLFGKKLGAKRKNSDCKMQLSNPLKLGKKPGKQPAKNKSLLEADAPAVQSQRENRLFKMLASSLREGSLLCADPVLEKVGSLLPLNHKRLRVHTEHNAKPSKVELCHSSKPTGFKTQTRSKSKEFVREASPAVESQIRFFTRRTTNHRRAKEVAEDPQDRLNTGQSSSAEKCPKKSKSPGPQEAPADSRASKFSPYLRSKWRRVVPESTAKKAVEGDPLYSRRTLGEATVQRFASLRSKEAACRQRMETTDTCSKEKRQQSSHLITTCRQLHRLRLKTSPRASPDAFDRPFVKQMKSMQVLTPGPVLVQTVKKTADFARGCLLNDYQQAVFLSAFQLEQCEAEEGQSPAGCPPADSPDRPTGLLRGPGTACLVPQCREAAPLTADTPMDSRLPSLDSYRAGTWSKSRPKINTEELFEQIPTVPQEPLSPNLCHSRTLKSRTLPVIVVRQSSNIYSIPVSKP